MATSSHLDTLATGTARDPAGQPGTRLLLRAGLLLGLLSAMTVAISIIGPMIGGKLSLAGNTPSDTEHDIVIGADHLRLPANTMRFEEQRRTGTAERVDLYLTWPEMQGYSEASRGRFNDVNRPDGLIFLQISQSTMSRDMTGRIEPIYRHLFEGPPMPGPAGLTAHAMKMSSGYGTETFFTGPATASDAADIYGIRCVLPQPPARSTSADCQRDIHAGQDLVVLYRFSSQLLPQWRAIDKAILAFVEARIVP